MRAKAHRQKRGDQEEVMNEASYVEGEYTRGAWLMGRMFEQEAVDEGIWGE